MVFVRLWNPSPARGLGPHGVVHKDCEEVRSRKVGEEWHESADEQTADRELSNYTLYWCTRLQCFGSLSPDNPRPFLR